jgi:hypothetical protein
VVVVVVVVIVVVVVVVVRYIKYKRLSWLGHVERMTNGRVAKTIYKWKPYATRPKGRARVRWEDDVRNDLRKMGRQCEE